MIHTFCNPLGVDYGMRAIGDGTAHRMGADPTIVLYKDNYYLFSTWDRPGYRKSHDLIHWEYIPFGEKAKAANGGRFSSEPLYTAPAVTVIGDYIYFLDYRHDSGNPRLIRTNDPDSGDWEFVTQYTGMYHDPCIFYDEAQNRIFLYHGLRSGIFVVELCSTTFHMLEGTQVQLALGNASDAGNAYQRPGWEYNVVTQNPNGPSYLGGSTCREGAWMTKHNGTYYLQIATPGTTTDGYGDTVYMSTSPTGPFVHCMYGPATSKPSGYIGSSGHSATFTDRYGNLWKTSTMWIGVHHNMERRIGLFPVDFDEEGRMYTLTELADYPILIPDKKVEDPSELMTAAHGWMNLTAGQAVTATASSTRSGSVFTDWQKRSAITREAKYAIDEDIQTWWSASTGNPGEYLQVDLGTECDIYAIQINFDEDGVRTNTIPTEGDFPRYQILASNDNQSFAVLEDRSENTLAGPHQYIQLQTPAKARYVRVENGKMVCNANFAISDLRIFGNAGGQLPSQVKNVQAVRNSMDARAAEITWDAVPDADGYIVRFGPEPGFLNRNYQVKNREGVHTLSLTDLGFRTPYYVTVDAFNQSGITRGGQPVLCSLPGGAHIPCRLHAVPGRLEAEEFDRGIKTYAYNCLSKDGVNLDIDPDTSSPEPDTTNAGGLYRTDAGIDIYPGEDETGYCVRLKTDEWMRYTIHVQKSGRYDISIRARGKNQRASVHFEDGAGNLLSLETVIPASNAYTSSVITGVFLAEEENALYLVCDWGIVDVDWFALTPSALE